MRSLNGQECPFYIRQAPILCDGCRRGPGANAETADLKFEIQQLVLFVFFVSDRTFNFLDRHLGFSAVLCVRK